MKIALTTPTGHIGNQLANMLLDQEADLTLIARHPEKVKDLRIAQLNRYFDVLLLPV